MSKNFSEAELCASRVALDMGIANIPSPEVKQNLRLTMAGLERIRAFLSYPIKVSSGYRCEALNKAVGGAKDSQHLLGQAVDFTCPGYGDPRKICLFLELYCGALGIDQLILEGTWVHVSFTPEPRGDLLTFLNGSYRHGIV